MIAISTSINCAIVAGSFSSCGGSSILFPQPGHSQCWKVIIIKVIFIIIIIKIIIITVVITIMTIMTTQVLALLA